MAEHAIDVEGLVREYKKGPRAVDGVDLYVERGEIYGFLGPNGAGKSTMVKMLVTLLPPSGGKATVGGFDIATQGDQVRRVIGVALQEAALDPLLTGREHLYLQAGLNGFGKKEAKERGETLLERVGLSGAGDRKIGTYSGGMRRRLDLALSLVHKPSIIFLDEPTTGLDPHSRNALWEEVRRLARDEGVTIFLTTQYLEEADVLARRVGIIDHGKIVAEGTPEELKAQIGGSTLEVTPGLAERPAAARDDAVALRRARSGGRGERRRCRPAPRARRSGGGSRSCARPGRGRALRPDPPPADARRRVSGQDRTPARGRRRRGARAAGGGRGRGGAARGRAPHGGRRDAAGSSGSPPRC